MKYNKLGNTGLLVSELCLGTMTFGGKGTWSAIGTLDQKPIDDLVKRSIDAGINFIDTANIYSEGLSEELTGKAIHNLGIKRDDIVLATKVRGRMGEGPNQAGLTRKHILSQVEESLRRLDTDYIDLYQIHGFDPLTPIEETLHALNTVVEHGKARYIGCSNLAAWQIMKALAYSKNKNLAEFVSLQAYYTVAGRDLEREIIPCINDQKLGLMVWSPLAGGFLSGKYTRDQQGEEGSRRINFDFPPIDKEKSYNIVDVLKPMAEEKSVSVAQLAIAWLLHQKPVTTVIIGAKKMDQLEDNLKAIEVQFNEEEMEKIDAISKLAREYPGWMIERQSQDHK